jgi:hypothetical protein
MSRRTIALIAGISSMVLVAGACNPMLSPSTAAASDGSVFASPTTDSSGVTAQGADDPAGDDHGMRGQGADDLPGDDHGGQGGGVDDPANHQ